MSNDATGQWSRVFRGGCPGHATARCSTLTTESGSTPASSYEALGGTVAPAATCPFIEPKVRA